MILLRRILFYLLMIAYLISCPLTILYALGVIYKPTQGDRFVKTGLIYLSTVPQGATIYLEDSRFTEKTPAMLRNLVPGNYRVKIVSPGYREWEQPIPVMAERASVLDYILLTPENRRSKQIIQGDFSDVTGFKENRYLLLSAGNNLEDYAVLDTNTRTLYRLAEKFPDFEGTRVRHAWSAPRSSDLVLELIQNGLSHYLKYDVGSVKGSGKTLPLLGNDKVEFLSWSEENSNYLYVLRGHRTERLDFSEDPVLPLVISEEVHGFGAANHHLYILKPDGSVVKTNSEGKEAEYLLQAEPSKRMSLFSPDEFYRIESYRSDLLIFTGAKGELIANRMPYRFLEEGLRGKAYDKKTKRLLIWTKDKLGILDFIKPESAPDEAFEAGPKLSWEFQSGQNIEQAYWVYEASHVLYRDGNKVYLLNLETYGKAKSELLVSVKNRSSIAYSDETGFLYYLDDGQGNLEQMEIWPKQQALSLPFPERKEMIWKKDRNE
ncbi:MAG: PEGA domain-containing protein [Candidatus Omnitrophota bacterium]|nr:PEGA domain-containing protein [Candidatus Omnitrophota bacterium]